MKTKCCICICFETPWLGRANDWLIRTYVAESNHKAAAETPKKNGEWRPPLQVGEGTQEPRGRQGGCTLIQTFSNLM